jgi:hypothetical protein
MKAGIVFNLFFIAIFVSMAFILSAGCVRSVTAETGMEIDPEKVFEIKIGETTRSQVFQLLGMPHSIFQGQAEFTEIHDLGEWYAHGSSRYLSSIDDDHIALLYRFSRASSKTTVKICSSKTKIKINADELLLLVDKKSSVVTEVAYTLKARRP